VPAERFSSRFRVLAARFEGRGAALAVASVALLGLLELGLHLYFSRAAPSLEQWSALKPVVARLAPSGTLVVASPRWAEPNARFAFGAELMPLGQVARADESGFEHALEVSILGEAASELRGWHLESEQREGAFVLRSWTNPQVSPVTYEFVDHLSPADATVSVLRAKGPAEPCPYGNGKVTNGDLGGHPTFPRKRFICSGAEWQMVGATVIEDQEYRPRRCIWAHPSNRGTLNVRFESVPIGARISGYGALPYLFERETHGTPIEVEVLVAGASVGRYQHLDGEGWKRFEFSTAAFAGQSQPVEFQVRSRVVRDRQFCFQASVR
jgi:hypothetical protein